MAQQNLCLGATHQYSVDKADNNGEGTIGSTYTWQVLESSFEGQINPLKSSGNQIEIDWGTTAEGVYTLEVKEVGTCGAATKTMTVTLSQNLAIDLPPTHYWCPDISTFTLNAPNGYDSYQWFDENDNLISNQQEAQITEIGHYRLVVTQNSCTAEAITEVVQVEFPTFTVNADFENSMIIVSVGGNTTVEYQLETYNGNVIYPWQSSNIFTNVPKGNYVVKVKSVDGECFTSFDAEALIVPNAITPNNDGYNDTWDLSKILSAYPNAVIEIYDRYGRKLREITAKDNFIWDGKINGIVAQTDNYWYLIKLNDKQTKSGSILLKNK